MILKIIIATIIIYVVYLLYKKYSQKKEGLDVSNDKLTDMCKSKCSDTYKRCVNNHCKEVVESNERRRRIEEEERRMENITDKQKKCMKNCHPPVTELMKKELDELQKEATRRGLESTGNKRELAVRLHNAWGPMKPASIDALQKEYSTREMEDAVSLLGLESIQKNTTDYVQQLAKRLWDNWGSNEQMRSICTNKCFRGNTNLNKTMKDCYARCDEDHSNELDRDECIAQCHTDNINTESIMNTINQEVVEGFSAPYNGANLNIATTPVLYPDEKNSMDYDMFKNYVYSKEFYKPPESIVRELYRKMSTGRRVEERKYKSYKPYLSGIMVDYDTFNEFADKNSLYVLSKEDRKQMFKRLDSSRSGYITYSSLIKGIRVTPMQYSYTTFVNIMKIYLRRLGLLNRFEEIHYRRLFNLAVGNSEYGNNDSTIIEGSDNVDGTVESRITKLEKKLNIIDATRLLNDSVAAQNAAAKPRFNPMRPTDFTADSDATGTRDYILRNEMDVLLNPIVRDLNKNRVNRMLERVLTEKNISDIERDLNSCNAIGRQRIDIAPIVDSGDMDNIAARVTEKMRKCQQAPIIPDKKENVNGDETNKDTSVNDKRELEMTDELINSIGKDLINSGLFKSYVERKCGFFCPANGKNVPDDKPLILPRQMRTGTTFDIWNPPSINVDVKEGESLSGRDLSYRDVDYWKQVPRKVLDKVCTDKNALLNHTTIKKI